MLVVLSRFVAVLNSSKGKCLLNKINGFLKSNHSGSDTKYHCYSLTGVDLDGLNALLPSTQSSSTTNTKSFFLSLDQYFARLPENMQTRCASEEQ